LEQQQKLYALERKAKEDNLSADEILKRRQTQAIPILKTMKEWMANQLPLVPPSSAIGKAISYSLKRWKLLSVYASEGHLEIDNNLIENKIRPLALGRKNYLFAHNENTAQNLVMLYSFIGTCHANDINPIKYISWILKKVVTDKVTPDAVKWLPHHIDPALLDA
jgi:transposase